MKMRGLGKLKSFQEIGNELGISKVTVKKEFDRAIAKIKAEIEHLDEEDQMIILEEIFETNYK